MRISLSIGRRGLAVWREEMEGECQKCGLKRVERKGREKNGMGEREGGEVGAKKRYSKGG